MKDDCLTSSSKIILLRSRCLPKKTMSVKIFEILVITLIILSSMLTLWMFSIEATGSSKNLPSLAAMDMALDSLSLQIEPRNDEPDFLQANVEGNSTKLDSVTLNDSMKQAILEFVASSQDDGKALIKSMDDAYHVGLSLYYLSKLDLQADNTTLNDLKTTVLNFINSARNKDGGYGNWKNAPSSMESTYQALIILDTFNLLGSITNEELNQTLTFIKSLETSEGGYYPLPQWDSPDVTSTYRALVLYQLINKTNPELLLDSQVIDVNKTVNFIANLYVPPFLISGASGFSEIPSGTPDLLSSYYAIQSLKMLGVTNESVIHATSVAAFLKQLTSSNGGITNKLGNLPTTGYTATGILLYLVLTELDAVNGTISEDFLPRAINYLKSTKKAGSGFSASDRDETPELSSTYFALRVFFELSKRQIITFQDLDISGILTFLVKGRDPTYGIGNYPGDRGNLERTAHAIIIGKLLQNTSWLNPKINDFISESYDPTKGGYGFRPGTKALVKYTYQGIRAARAIGQSLTFRDEIISFLAKSQNDDGGFGQTPRSKLSYLTHTYWAIQGLKFLSKDSLELHINVTALRTYLQRLRYTDGTFGNFFGWNKTLTSTYRGVSLLALLGDLNRSSDRLASTLLTYFYLPQVGGFRPSLTKTTPTLKATHEGTWLSYILNIPLNTTRVREFVLSLYNPDGGFAPRPRFSSRVSATYHALLTLQLLDIMENDGQGNVPPPLIIGRENPSDVYAPIIEPIYVPRLDINKTFTGTYNLIAFIRDPESIINDTWAELIWQSNTSKKTFQLPGIQSSDSSEKWIFYLGPFSENGFLLVRIHARDESGNIATSEWLSFKTVSNLKLSGKITIDWVNILIFMIMPLTLVAGTSDDLLRAYRRKKMSLEDIKMEIALNKNEENITRFSLLNNLNVAYVLLIMAIISILARLFLGHALLILDQSTFLFRFLLGALLILAARYMMGIRSYGFFAPMVLVISWLQIGPIWAASVFMVVFLIALQVRRQIDPLNLGYGFRIAILMVSSITSLALLEIIGETFRIASLSTSILLPIIITPNIADRYVRTANETNEAESFIILMNTLLISAAAYLLMSFDPLVRFIVLNPETWTLITFVMLYFARFSRHTRVDKKRFQRLYKKGEQPLTLLIRNRDYIARYNQAVLFPIVNKFNMKEQFEKWHVPTAETYAVIDNEKDVPNLMKRLIEEDTFKNGFVIKPAQSFGGKGIIVVKKRTDDGYFIIENDKYHLKALEDHIIKILQGEFMTSVTKADKDIVIVEEKITVHPDLADISLGLPDVRVIVFRGIPVMAMARLPTSESHGKANLKQGAIGAAISISKGIIFRAEKKGIPLQKHPDTKNQIVGFQFKNWQEILATACLAQKSSGLGYAGVDIVIDDQRRILVLEINKRPGLEIQNVNQASLLSRLKFLEEHDLDATNLSPTRSARMGIELAINEWEKELLSEERTDNTKN